MYSKITFEIGAANEEYGQHLYEELASLTSSPIAPVNRKPDPRTGNTYLSSRFSTISLSSLKPLTAPFLDGKTRVVPSNIHELITPLGLAF